MTIYNFTEAEKEVLFPLIEERYISIFETYDMPRQKDMDAINELKDEFVDPKDEEGDVQGTVLGKNSRSVLCSIIDEKIISPNTELMSDIKQMEQEDLDEMATEYKQIIEFVKYYTALKNKISPYKKLKK
ncbi:MAG: hypothetical protein KAH10_00010 [Flavobacteriales bacterium]|nr:hypothetical protein [Flavobacteriales bacterium]